eukprot:CAMPEP_0201624768 /NCGR_PEP_ID=MMETSP0493-20130528/827_1 /ASSEMBLY_ACC=CAM_ASM_000838 /TAXON_ID=420259 /ORGANISM="Thalassiosira gravida, Strain GMp14c1" /LENGTH=286 /DNA_ID=CAMNT_0048094651 /DNA_START=115 /DNA_END=975 /DNA_ORIENTATION=+
MVSAEKSALRGPVVATSDTVVEGSASSVDVDSKSNGKSNDLKAVKLPKFFPTDLTEDQIISFKKTAAEKRQDKRDAKRARDNPNRSQSEEDAERARKTDQSRKRNDPSVDPYSGGDGGNGSRDYGKNREAKRATKCERNGEGCNYSGPNQSCYNDCLSGTSLGDRVCARKCKYIDTQCNENCRDDGGSIGDCLDECEENIDSMNDDNGNRGRNKNKNNNNNDNDDGNRGRNKNNNRNNNRNNNNNDDGNDDGPNNRSNCKVNCGDSFNTDSKKYRKCIVACPNEYA